MGMIFKSLTVNIQLDSPSASAFETAQFSFAAFAYSVFAPGSDEIRISIDGIGTLVNTVAV